MKSGKEEKMVKLIIPGELPDLNTIIEESKKGRGKCQPYSKLKRINTDKVAWIAKTKIKEQFSKIDLEITWICKDRRKDKDNIMAGGLKMILDGLVGAGAIPNDGWKHVGSITNHFEVDKNDPRIEIQITQA